MSRYNTYTPLDDGAMEDGDVAFIKFASRYQNTVSEPGTLEVSQNMRLNRTTARVRAGLKAISTDLTLNNPPLVLNFMLGVDVGVSSITRSSTTASVTTTTAHGYTTGDKVNIRGAVETQYNGDKTITVTGANTFTYTVAGSPSTPATGTIIANKGPILLNTYNDVVRCSETFATNDDDNTEYIIAASTDSAWAIRGGVASQQIAYPAGEQVESTDKASMKYWNGNVYIFRGYQTAPPFTPVSITRSSTTATVTTSAAHGLLANSWVFVKGASQIEYNGIFKIASTPTTTTFTYTVAGSPATPATGTITIRPCKPALVWNGDFASAFTTVTTGASSGTRIHMPPCDWGVDFKNRLVIPFNRDETLLSDVYDGDTYDTLFNELRIRGGTNDWLIGVHPYQDNQLLVLYRRSIHMLDLDPASLGLAAATEITRDIGCVARRSIVTCGERILWLSDRGVQALNIGDLLSLKQSSQPLSTDIDDIIQRINYAYADAIVATYWDNRYFLAVPLDGSTTANTILVYNFLNQGWETVDTYPSGFNVENFHQIDYSGSKRLHVTTSFGFAYVTEELDGDEWGQTNAQVPINGALTTRYYIAGSTAPKKVRRFLMEVNPSAGDTFIVSAATKNLDAVSTPETFTFTRTTDVYMKLPYFGLYGTGAQLRITTTSGRPEFRSVTAEFQSLASRVNYNLP